MNQPASLLNFGHEQNSMRRHARIKMPLEVRVKGERFTAFDWSMGGVGFSDCPLRLQMGEIFPLELVVPFSGFTFDLMINSQIVWTGNGGRYGCQFLDLNQEQSAMLRYLVDAFMSGKIASVGGLLTSSIPSPLRKSTGVSPHFNVLSPWEKWQDVIRIAARLSLFMFLSGIVLVLISLSLYNHVFTLEGRSAEIYTPALIIRSPSSGYVEWRSNADGRLVKKGEVLVRISNPDLRGKLQIAQGELQKERTRFKQLTMQLRKRDSVNEKMSELARETASSFASTYQITTQAYEVAKREYARDLNLYKKKVISGMQLNDSRQNFLKAQTDMEQAKIGFLQATSNEEVGGIKGSKTAPVYTGDNGNLLVEVEVAKQSLAVAGEQVRMLEQQIANLVAKSPCDCVIWQILVIPGQWIQSGEAIIELQANENSPNFVTAFIPYEDASTITVGNPAYVKLSNLDSVVKGTVASVQNRLNENSLRQRSAESIAQVRLAAVKINVPKGIVNTENGAPAKVRIATNKFVFLTHYWDKFWSMFKKSKSKRKRSNGKN